LTPQVYCILGFVHLLGFSRMYWYPDIETRENFAAKSNLGPIVVRKPAPVVP
jgi:hypothetical protein